MTEENKNATEIVKAEIVSDSGWYRIFDDYHAFYSDCPYCKSTNNLGGDKSTKEAIIKRQLFLCGKCNKPFYITRDINY